MGMKLVARALVLTVVGVAGVSVALASTTGTVKTAKNSKLGSIVVSAGGMTLYHLSGEKKGSIKCSGQCSAFWPPLIVTGKPKAGAGINAAKLGTIKRSNGKLQVTYNGYALYRYYNDHKAGETNGEDQPGLPGTGTWYAVSPAGKAVTSSGGGDTTSTSTTTTDDTTTTGGGYGKGY
jgi:predicted lipoprotein with Yx(FWY)xxD motif